MRVTARLKNAVISAQKMRLVAKQIRNKSLGEAAELLEFGQTKAARLMKKLLDSAVANAENVHGANIDDMRVSTVMVDQGFTLKRVMPRAKGRADRISKRRCHVSLEIESIDWE